MFIKTFLNRISTAIKKEKDSVDPITYLRDSIQLSKALVDGNFTDFQPMSFLEKWPVGEIKNLDGNLCEKVSDSNTEIRFECTTPPGGSYLLHWHDVFEFVRMNSGTFHLFIGDPPVMKEVKAGESFTISPGIKHYLLNPSKTQECTYSVVFKKKNNDRINT